MPETSPLPSLFLSVCLATALAGCAASRADPPVAVASPESTDAPGLAELKNATYSGFEEPAEPVTLANGHWEGKPYVEGAAVRPAVTFVRDFRLVGDLDGDGRDEAVVLLATSTGGSGEIIYLAVVGRDGDRIKNRATARVGDRVKLRAGRIEGGKIFLDVLQAGPEDAACCPGELATRGWQLGADGLTEISTGIATTRLSLAAIGGAEWVLRSWDFHEPAPPAPEVTLSLREGRFEGLAGCNRYFAPVKETGAPGDIAVGLAGATRIACPPPTMALEGRFFRQLSGVTKFGFLAGQLALTYIEDGRPHVMLFDRREPRAGER